MPSSTPTDVAKPVLPYTKHMAEWMNELRELDALHKDGLITDAEFEAERIKIVPSARVMNNKSNIDPEARILDESDSETTFTPPSPPAKSEIPYDEYYEYDEVEGYGDFQRGTIDDDEYIESIYQDILKSVTDFSADYADDLEYTEETHL